MKRNIKLFIFVILCLFVVKVDGVFADTFQVQYFGCESLKDNGGQIILGSSSPSQTVTVGSNTKTYECQDSNFLGWKVYVASSRNSSGWYCVDDNAATRHSTVGSTDESAACPQGTYVFNNGFVFSRTGSDGAAQGDVFQLYVVYQNDASAFLAQFDPGINEGVTCTTDDDPCMEPFYIVIGSSTNLPRNQFVRDGYTFAGWNAQTNGGQWMCNDGNLDYDDCSGHGGRKVYADGEAVSQTGLPGSTVVFVATWTSGSRVIQPATPCENYGDKDHCESNNCSWNNTYNFCSVTGLAYLTCGSADDIPIMVPDMVSKGVTSLKTVAPLVLIIMSIISLVKAITSGKEEDIKKAQTGLIKKVIAAALIFFIITIVQFVMLKVSSSNEKQSLSDCLSCFLNGQDDCGIKYYKDSNGNRKTIN